VYGLSRIFSPGTTPFVRLVWVVTILVSAFFGIYSTIRTINDYNEYNVITNIERINPRNVTFPGIKVCIYNYMRKGYYLNEIKVKEELATDYDFKNFISDASYETDVNGSVVMIDVTERLEFFMETERSLKCLR
jgi:hypothetical protein